MKQRKGLVMEDYTEKEIVEQDLKEIRALVMWKSKEIGFQTDDVGCAMALRLECAWDGQARNRPL